MDTLVVETLEDDSRGRSPSPAPSVQQLQLQQQRFSIGQAQGMPAPTIVNSARRVSMMRRASLTLSDAIRSVAAVPEEAPPQPRRSSVVGADSLSSPRDSLQLQRAFGGAPSANSPFPAPAFSSGVPAEARKAQRARPLFVHCRCSLNSLDRVDTMTQTFAGDVSVHCTVSVPVVQRLTRRRKGAGPLTLPGAFSDDPSAAVTDSARAVGIVNFGTAVSDAELRRSLLRRGAGKSAATGGVTRRIGAAGEVDGDDDGEGEEIEAPSLEVFDPSLFLDPPEVFARRFGLESISDADVRGRLYIDLLESRLLELSVTNLLESDGGGGRACERLLLLHTDEPPAGVKPSRLVPGGPGAYERFSCFTLVKRYKSTFRQMFGLQQFPLDTQYLIVELELGRGEAKLCFAPVADPKPEESPLTAGRVFEAERCDMLVLEPGHCPALNEWDVFRKITAQTHVTEPERSHAAIQFSRQRFLFKVRRKYRAYIDNVAVTTFLITTMTGTAFFVDPTADSAIANRLAVIVTLLLAAVSFRFVVRSYLPSIAYMTLADHYVRGSMVCIVMSAFEVALVGTSLAGKPSLAFVDQCAWLALGFGWLMFNFYAALRVFRHHLSLDPSLLYTDLSIVQAEEAARAAATLMPSEAELQAFLDQNDDDDPGSPTPSRPGSSRPGSSRPCSSQGRRHHPRVVPAVNTPAWAYALTDADRQAGQLYGWRFSGLPGDDSVPRPRRASLNAARMFVAASRRLSQDLSGR